MTAMVLLSGADFRRSSSFIATETASPASIDTDDCDNRVAVSAAATGADAGVTPILRLRRRQSRARNARIAASFLGLSTEAEDDAPWERCETWLPPPLPTASMEVHVSNRAVGTSFLDVDHVHSSIARRPSSFWSYWSAVEHCRSAVALPRRPSSFWWDWSPPVMAARCIEAALHAEDEAAYAFRKSISVNDMAEKAIMYCYIAVFLCMVSAVIGVVNGIVDLWSTRRDENNCQQYEDMIHDSGWPAFMEKSRNGEARDA